MKKGKKIKPFPPRFPPSVTIRDCGRKRDFAVLYEQKCVVLGFFWKPWSVSFQSSLQQSGSNQLKAWKRHYVIAKDKKPSQHWSLVAEASLWPHPAQDLWRTLCSSGPSQKIASAKFQQTIPAFPSPASGLWVFWSLSHVWVGIH